MIIFIPQSPNLLGQYIALKKAWMKISRYFILIKLKKYIFEHEIRKTKQSKNMLPTENWKLKMKIWHMVITDHYTNKWRPVETFQCEFWFYLIYFFIPVKPTDRPKFQPNDDFIDLISGTWTFLYSDGIEGKFNISKTGLITLLGEKNWGEVRITYSSSFLIRF